MKAFRMRCMVMVLVVLLGGALSHAQAETLLPVLFKAQVPPGTWSGTSNCGQGSINMVIAYHQGVQPTAEGIMAIDEWLAQSDWDIPIDNYNSSSTKPWILADVAQKYGGFPDSYWATNWTIDDIKNSIDQGLPVVLRVYTSYLTNRGYGYVGRHYIVAIGYGDGYIVCNDPGSASGGGKHYSEYDLNRALTLGSGSDWTDGSVTVVVPNGEVKPPANGLPDAPPVEEPPVEEEPPVAEEPPVVEEPPVIEEPQPEEPPVVRQPRVRQWRNYTPTTRWKYSDRSTGWNRQRR